jgi:two-component system, OmpR family, response regulator BaeR
LGAVPARLVEDDPRIALLLLDYLRSEGFEAHGLADGQLALSEVEHAPPDLLIRHLRFAPVGDSSNQ